MALRFDSTGKKSGKTDMGRIEDGVYPSRIVQILDFGMQYKTHWQTGEIEKYEDSGSPIVQHKVWINFEFPTETVEIDGEQKPRWLGKEFTVSSHEKSALTALVKAADPTGKHTTKGRNVKALLGLPVMVTVASTVSGKAKVSSVAGLMKGMAVAELSNPPVFFDLDEVDVGTFEGLPDWMKTRIEEGVDFDKTAFGQLSKAQGDSSPY